MEDASVAMGLLGKILSGGGFVDLQSWPNSGHRLFIDGHWYLNDDEANLVRTVVAASTGERPDDAADGEQQANDED